MVLLGVTIIQKLMGPHNILFTIKESLAQGLRDASIGLLLVFFLYMRNSVLVKFIILLHKQTARLVLLSLNEKT